MSIFLHFIHLCVKLAPLGCVTASIGSVSCRKCCQIQKWNESSWIFFVFFPHKPSLTHIICFSTGLCIDTGINYIYSIIGSSVFADSSTESASWTATRAAVIMRHMQNWSWKPVGRKNSWESLRFQLEFDMSALNTGRLDVFSLLYFFFFFSSVFGDIFCSTFPNYSHKYYKSLQDKLVQSNQC